MTIMNEHAECLFVEASGYMKTLERSLVVRSRFNNDLLYGIAAMSFEKLFVSLLARYNKNAMHHTPMALFQEADGIMPLPE